MKASESTIDFEQLQKTSAERKEFRERIMLRFGLIAFCWRFSGYSNWHGASLVRPL